MSSFNGAGTLGTSGGAALIWCDGRNFDIWKLVDGYCNVEFSLSALLYWMVAWTKQTEKIWREQSDTAESAVVDVTHTGMMGDGH
jgi:hypothetical protein